MKTVKLGLAVFSVTAVIAFAVMLSACDGDSSTEPSGPEINPPDFVGKWGTQGSNDGEFEQPTGVAVGNGGKVYVADTNNHRIQYFTADGKFLGKWGSKGGGEGRFNSPVSVDAAPNGNIYVSDTENGVVKYFTPTGDYLGGWGIWGNPFYPAGLAVGANGKVYVADPFDNAVYYFTSTGTFIKGWGREGSGNGEFRSPYAIAAAPDGTIYVGDSENTRIQYFTATGSFLGKWGSAGSGNGQFGGINGLGVGPDGKVYVADYLPSTNTDRVQYFTKDGVFLGKWGVHGNGDGQFDTACEIAFADNGNIYVVEYGNNRVQYFRFAQ